MIPEGLTFTLAEGTPEALVVKIVPGLRMVRINRWDEHFTLLDVDFRNRKRLRVKFAENTDRWERWEEFVPVVAIKLLRTEN